MSSLDEMTPEALFDAFVNGRLPKDAWTHEAHLVTCWVALQDRTPSQTLAFLRQAIQTHNCGIGIRNTETSGYHETLTVYYVTAVAQASAASLDELLQVPSCSRTAALEHWSKDVLFCSEARQHWVSPDKAPLPWAQTSDEADLSSSPRLG